MLNEAVKALGSGADIINGGLVINDVNSEAGYTDDAIQALLSGKISNLAIHRHGTVKDFHDSWLAFEGKIKSKGVPASKVILNESGYAIPYGNKSEEALLEQAVHTTGKILAAKSWGLGGAVAFHLGGLSFSNGSNEDLLYDGDFSLIDFENGQLNPRIGYYALKAAVKFTKGLEPSKGWNFMYPGNNESNTGFLWGFEGKGRKTLAALKYKPTDEQIRAFFGSDGYDAEYNISGEKIAKGSGTAKNGIIYLIAPGKAPTITTINLPNGSTGKAYYVRLNAKGTTPITWKKSGSLPSGLTFKDRVISGTPKTAKKSTFTVTATNEIGKATKKFTIQTYIPVSITTKTLKDATEGNSYNVNLKANGTKPITWSATGLPRGMSFNVKTGKISGKPTVYGNFRVTVTAKNDYSKATGTFTLRVKAVKPTLSGSLKRPELNKPYSSKLNVKGSQPIEWSISGNLPDGLEFDEETGVISGTPTSYLKSGYKVTITAKGPGGSKSKTVTLKVKGTAPTITGTLKQAELYKAYSAVLKVKGSDTIKLSMSGKLPDGLTFDEKTGTISGTPKSYEKSGYKFTVTATNPVGSKSKTFTLKVKGTAPTLSGSLKSPELNKAYSGSLKVKGTEPITWSMSGELPDGLTFDEETGTISGTPTSYSKSGYKITITVSNIVGTKSKKITLKVKGTAPSIKTTKLPNATQWSSYSVALNATGSDPIIWRAEGLPNGLSLNGNTIEGTPTVSGKKFTVTVYAENPVKEVKKNLSLRIDAAEKPETVNDTKSPKDTETSPTEPTDKSTPPEIPEQEVPESPEDDEDTAHSEGEYVVVARLGEISRDVEGMYDFDVTLSDDAVVGAELVYIANSSEPSNDDEIAEFFDDTGKEITEVPDNRHITISIWLHADTIYNPSIAVKQ